MRNLLSRPIHLILDDCQDGGRDCLLVMAWPRAATIPERKDHVRTIGLDPGKAVAIDVCAYLGLVQAPDLGTPLDRYLRVENFSGRPDLCWSSQTMNASAIIITFEDRLN